MTSPPVSDTPPTAAAAVLISLLWLERKRAAQEKRRQTEYGNNTKLTYVDIPEKMEPMKKKRTTVWLPETAVAKLKKLSEATGAPMAELFRRAVEAYLKTS